MNENNNKTDEALCIAYKLIRWSINSIQINQLKHNSVQIKSDEALCIVEKYLKKIEQQFQQ
jgi:hypothetical protein